MKSATQILSEEHQTILKVIDLVIEKCLEAEKSNEMDTDFFEHAIDFIRNYADAFHHAKEEDILFKILGQDDVPMPSGPVEQMIIEHNMGREYVKAAATGLSENNLQTVCENARNYCQLLQQHIYKEDNILYPMADRVLSEAQQKQMLLAMENVEKNKFKPGDISKYIKMADSGVFL